jgi:hypothetical protein
LLDRHQDENPERDGTMGIFESITHNADDAAAPFFLLEVDAGMGKGFERVYNGADQKLEICVEPGLCYSFRTKATYGASESAWSREVTLATQATVPARPAAPVTCVVGSEAAGFFLQVSWVRGKDGGLPIEHFDVQMAVAAPEPTAPYFGAEPHDSPTASITPSPSPAGSRGSSRASGRLGSAGSGAGAWAVRGVFSGPRTACTIPLAAVREAGAVAGARFRVQARNAAGCSLWSAWSGPPFGQDPDLPTPLRHLSPSGTLPPLSSPSGVLPPLSSPSGPLPPLSSPSGPLPPLPAAGNPLAPLAPASAGTPPRALPVEDAAAAARHLAIVAAPELRQAGPAELCVSWEACAAAGDAKGSSDIAYRLEMEDRSLGADKWEAAYEGQSTACEVRLGRAGSAYAFRVRAEHGAGAATGGDAGAWSPTVVFVTPAAAPDAPAAPEVGASGVAGAVRVRWGLPCGNGLPLLACVVEARLEARPPDGAGAGAGASVGADAGVGAAEGVAEGHAWCEVFEGEGAECAVPGLQVGRGLQRHRHPPSCAGPACAAGRRLIHARGAAACRSEPRTASACARGMRWGAESGARQHGSR